jgi:hypothetical protein
MIIIIEKFDNLLPFLFFKIHAFMHFDAKHKFLGRTTVGNESIFP